VYAVTQNVNSILVVRYREELREEKETKAELEKRGKLAEERDRIFDRRALLQSAIVLYLAPLLSPLLPRLFFFVLNSSFH